MSSRTLVLAGVLASMCACGTPQSTFDFVMTGSTTPQARVSDLAASGVVDNTGILTIDDTAWQLGITLGGLGEGNHGAVGLTIIDKNSARIFSTEQGGACSAFVDPHDTTNGSALSGHFTCTGLSDGTGDVVDVNGVEFLTYISDAANNPPKP
jgi:hypothetical protein